jgi:hypothetical protein
MQPRPPFDRELLIPIAVAVVSILGLAWIFLANYRPASLIPPTVEVTVIPFNVSPVRTRTLPPPKSATPTLEETPLTSEETSPTATATSTSLVAYPGPPAETLPSASTLVTGSLPAPSITLASDQSEPLPPGKYDNTHPSIAYDRHWTFRMNSGTKFAYKGTLHTSDSIGNELSFRFTGQRIILGYQRGRSFGTVTVIIDDQTYSFHEQAFGNLWRSPQLTPGIHVVRIIHENGESVNLDYIEVL